MPNWTTNAIAVRLEDLGRFIKDGDVDFNLLRPMPKELDIVDGSIQSHAVRAAQGASEEEVGVMHYPIKSQRDFGSPLPFDIENFDDLKRVGEVYLNNERRYGSQTWYDWRCRNWGTKWNACESRVHIHDDIAIMTFDTAWCAPSKEMFDNAGVPYYAESYDENFNGVYRWNGLPGGLLFQEATFEDDDYTWHTGDYSPNIPKLKEKLAKESR